MTTAERARGRTEGAKGAGFNKGAFYRLCRMLHAYLSAFAFLALIFFALTGLLLDHPNWLQSKPREQEVRLAVPAVLMNAASQAHDQPAVLAATVARLTPLVGAYKSGEIDDGEANLRFEGTKGSSTVTVDMRNGATDVALQHATVVSVIGDLHRGKNAGAAWRLVIDISAVVILALSLIGYVLFFSLRFRLRTSLILTVMSLGVLVGVFVLLTP